MKLEFLESETNNNEIKILPKYHQIAFFASICERLIPLYEIFARETEWEDASFRLVCNCLDEIWLFIEHKTLDELKFRRLLLDCKLVIPDGYSICHKYVYEAEYSAGALWGILKFCLTSDEQFIKYILCCAHYTIYDYLNWQIDESSEPDMSAKERHKIIFKHPFTIREMTKENEDLQQLKKTSVLSSEFLHCFRTSSKDPGKHVLDAA